MKSFSIRYLLRSTGLAAVLRRWHHSPEPKKYVVRTSFWIALQRCMVHLLPSAASIVVITLNLKGFFIGFELAGIPGHDAMSIAALQVTAKLQEFLIVASVASVLFHRLRHDMLRGRGMPFGLLGCGLSFTQLSYLWSPEFLASFGAKGNRTLYALIILAAAMATMAGPATALLVIPRTILWPAGETNYYINGTKEILWPTTVGMEHYLPPYTNAFNESVDCGSSRGYKSAVCLSGGFKSLLQHFSGDTFRTQAGIPISDPDSTRLFAHSVRGGILVESPDGQVAAQTISGQVRGEDLTETFAFATHSATTNLQMFLNRDWALAAEYAQYLYPQSWQVSRLRFYAIQENSVRSQVPAVRVLCLGQNLTANSSTVSFPALPEYDVGISITGQVLRNHTVAVNNLSNKASNGSSLFWTDLNQILPANESMSQGFILEGPRHGDGSRPVIGCSIDARWASATVWSRFPGPFQASFVSNRPATGGFRKTSFLPQNDGTWRRIQFSPSWVSAVDFPLPDALSNQSWSNSTAFSTLITASGIESSLAALDQKAIAFLEYILATSFADALSRVSSHVSYSITPDTHISQWPLLNYNSTPATPDILSWSRALRPSDLTRNPTKYTIMHMQETVTGFGYQASNVSDYLSLLVLFTHILIAFAHTTYVLGFTRRTSGCWDTFSELVVLAQQSLPTKRALRNTCAGIQCAETFRRRVRVKVSKWNDAHLELGFNSEDESDGWESEDEIDFGKKYGG
ncbi:hypothetical protein K432DRAFT_383222 [Lepidopterella palustris CBS 459.81]|uniref:Uncharacterized protein n=1 Tax=Lepidopterella palustris CBS 459.81 TaxID=1314670 RepID=A0A8E2E8A3_9PEZI|nr:hypothetical protein K432DRAFT_383222 [Lepidopterella palustris CBS 459.81]